MKRILGELIGVGKSILYKSMEISSNQPLTTQLQNGIYIYIGYNDLYGFCDVVSVAKHHRAYSLKPIIDNGHGVLRTDISIAQAGQRTIWINESSNQIEFRQNYETMRVKVIIIG